MGSVRAGLLSDTHGRLDGALWKLFEGVDLILHAGDVGNFDLLRELETIAPVRAIRGNMDPYHSQYPEIVTTNVGGLTVHVRHKVDTRQTMLEFFTRRVEADIVLFGHTHMPFLKRVRNTLFVNPGSASRPRTGPNSAGLLVVEDARPLVTVHSLADPDFHVMQRWPPVDRT